MRRTAILCVYWGLVCMLGCKAAKPKIDFIHLTRASVSNTMADYHTEGATRSQREAHLRRQMDQWDRP